MRWDRASLDQAITLNPGYTWAYGQRGFAFSYQKTVTRKGDYDRAIADYSEAIRLDPKWAWARSSRGFAYKNKGDYDHAIAKAYEVAYTSFLPNANLPLAGVAKRSAFVIDSHGVIQYSESSDDPKVLPNFDAIEAKLKELA